MEYLKKEDIILINQLTLKKHGGNYVPPFNLLNEPSLDYLIEAVQSKLFGEELYSAIAEKAGLYMFSIISNHVFQDGNKRTGLESGLLFLRLNGYELRNELERIKTEAGKTAPKKGTTKNDQLYHFIMEIASGEITMKDCRKWIERNIQKS